MNWIRPRDIVGFCFCVVVATVSVAGFINTALLVLGVATIWRARLFRARVDIVGFCAQLAFFISLIQFASMIAVYLLEISPLSLVEQRQPYFTQSAVSLAALSTGLQTFIMSYAAPLSSNSTVRFYRVSPIFMYLVLAASYFLSYKANDNDFFFVTAYSTFIEMSGSQSWGGWSVLYIIASSFLLLHIGRTSKKMYSLIALSIFCQILYFLLHGNRSEVTIQAILLTLSMLNGNELYRERIHLGVRGLVAGSLIIVGLYLIGEIRDGGFSSDQLTASRDYLYLSTFSGSMWSQIVVTSLYTWSGELQGSTYLDHLKNILPSFVPVPWERAPEAMTFIAEGSVVGGMGFWGEAYLNFGIFGVIAYSFLIVWLIRSLTSNASKSAYASLLLVAIAIYMPRFFLYDFVYLVKLLTFFAVLWVLSSMYSSISINQSRAARR